MGGGGNPYCIMELTPITYPPNPLVKWCKRLSSLVLEKWLQPALAESPKCMGLGTPALWNVKHQSGDIPCSSKESSKMPGRVQRPRELQRSLQKSQNSHSNIPLHSVGNLPGAVSTLLTIHL